MNLLRHGACSCESMPQIASRPRVAPVRSSIPLAVGDGFEPKEPAARVVEHEALESAYQEPAMRSPMLPLLWLLVPFVVTIIVGIVTN